MRCDRKCTDVRSVGHAGRGEAPRGGGGLDTFEMKRDEWGV